MRIAVFGGSGFLGSHVADALTDAGHDVTIYDLKASPYLKPNQKMVQGDILDQEKIDGLVRDNDVIYHFAGIADIDECTDRPLDVVKYNIQGTVQILDACRKYSNHIKRFVFASSAYVYSDAGYFYRSSKHACESFIENYQQLFGIPYTILRYGSLYGERSDERNRIYQLIYQALSEGKITYYGTGEELREYIHVQDAALNSVKILDPEFENQHMVLTGSQSLRSKELLDMISEILGRKVEVEIKSSSRAAHYKITPYNFSPKLGRKMVGNTQIDMGQGLLSCMAEIYVQLHADLQENMGLLLEDPVT